MARLCPADATRRATNWRLCQAWSSSAEGSLYTHAVEELVAIAAAIGANCEPCFKYHFQEARKAGVTRDDIALAVATARKVKEAAAQVILKLAGKHLAAEREVQLLKIAPCCPGGSEGADAEVLLMRVTHAALGRRFSCLIYRISTIYDYADPI